MKPNNAEMPDPPPRTIGGSSREIVIAAVFAVLGAGIIVVFSSLIYNF